MHSRPIQRLITTRGDMYFRHIQPKLLALNGLLHTAQQDSGTGKSRFSLRTISDSPNHIPNALATLSSCSIPLNICKAKSFDFGMS